MLLLMLLLLMLLLVGIQGKLIVCYDDNLITIDGSTALSFTEDVNKRYEAYGWHVLTVPDVNDAASMCAALEAARAVTDKPSIIKIRTVIGEGSAKAGTHGVHGSPLGDADLANLKTKFGFDPTQVSVAGGRLWWWWLSAVLVLKLNTGLTTLVLQLFCSVVQ